MTRMDFAEQLKSAKNISAERYLLKILSSGTLAVF